MYHGYAHKKDITITTKLQNILTINTVLKRRQNPVTFGCDTTDGQGHMSHIIDHVTQVNDHVIYANSHVTHITDHMLQINDHVNPYK